MKRSALYIIAFLCLMLMLILVGILLGMTDKGKAPPAADPEAVYPDDTADAQTDDPEEMLDSELEALLEDIQQQNEENPHVSPSVPHADLTPDDTPETENPQEDKPQEPAQSAPDAAGSVLPDYEVTDGAAAVTGFSQADAEPDAALAVPETLGGLPVRSVAKYGFYGAKYAERVQLPASIETMGDYAFNGSSLQTFAFVPETALTVGNFAFADCKALETVRFADRTYTLGDYCFEDSTAVSVKAEGSVLTLGDFCFKDAGQLEEVQISGNLTTGESCFRNCESLSEVTFSGGTLSLGDCSFQNTGARTAAFTDCTGTLGAECFADSDRLRKLTVCEGITSFGDYAFAGCKNLREVYLPASLSDLPDTCFSDCPNVVLHAPAGSAAYQFAERNGIPVREM